MTDETWSPRRLWITLGLIAAGLVIWGASYSVRFARMAAQVEGLQEMNRRLWTEVQLLQSEINQLESDLRREGFEMRRAGSHDKGE